MLQSNPLSAHEVADVLSHIPPRPSYDQWLRIISAVASELPEHEAESVLQAWSPEDRQGEYRQKIRNRLKQVGVGTLLQIASENGFDVKEFNRSRASATHAPFARSRLAIKQHEQAPILPHVEPMPTPDALIWNEGVDYLLKNPDACTRIDEWRGYQAGSVYGLAEAGLIASPVLRGRRTLAFAVTTPDGLQIGFHARHKPTAQGQRPSWSYHPAGIPALAFQMGGGGGAQHHAKIRRVVLTEGQWDTIALASSLGWLSRDTAFDEHTLFLGARGASGVNPVFDWWIHRLPKSAKWIVYRDADKTGESWSKVADRLASHGFSVILRYPANGKDVNETLRNRLVTAQEVLQ